MTEQISQRELRNESGRVMRGLEDGRTFIVTSHGQPVGELRPLRRARFVDARTVLDTFNAGASVDLDRLRTDLDATADQSF